MMPTAVVCSARWYPQSGLADTQQCPRSALGLHELELVVAMSVVRLAIRPVLRSSRPYDG